MILCQNPDARKEHPGSWFGGICYGLRGALEGLIEQGCDGPCKDALNLLDKHLNKSAHRPEL